MTNSSVLHDHTIVGSPVLHIISLSVLLFAFWMLLSGNTETLFMTYGVVTSLVAAWVCYPLLLLPNADGTKKYFVFGISPVKVVLYFFWLMWQLIVANIDVISATVRPELKINPRVKRFRYKMDNPMGTVILANSITLTPGTVTMNVTPDGEFDIHVLTDGADFSETDPKAMPAKVAWLLGQDFEMEVLGEEF